MLQSVEDVEEEIVERVEATNTRSSVRRHRNPTPSPAPSSTSLQRVDHSQMNHIGPPQPSRRSDRGSVTPSGSTASVSEGGGGGFHHRHRHTEPGDRHSTQWPEEDVSWTAEVDGAVPPDGVPADAVAADDSATEKPEEGSAEKSRLQAARPSLRLRRRFDCPDLVIINRNPSAEDVAMACTSRADPAPAPQPQRRVTPPPPSSYSSASGSTFVSRLPRRRLTMPGIIKYDPVDIALHSPTSSRNTSPTEPLPAEYITDTVATDAAPSAPAHVEAGFGVRGGRPAAAMYLVENCARKRLQEEQLSEAEMTAALEGQQTAAVAPIVDVPSLDGLDPPKPLSMRYRQVVLFIVIVNCTLYMELHQSKHTANNKSLTTVGSHSFKFTALNDWYTLSPRDDNYCIDISFFVYLILCPHIVKK